MADRSDFTSAGMHGSRRSTMRGRPVVEPKNMKGTLRRLWELTKGHRKGFGWLMLLAALDSVAAIVSPLVIGRAVSRINNAEPAATILIILLSLYIGGYFIEFLQQFFMAAVGQKIIHHIRLTLFAAMTEKPLAFFDMHLHGELMSRLTNDIDNISSTITDSLTKLLSYVFTIIGIFCIMISINVPLTGIALIGVLLICIMTRMITKRTRKLYAEQQKLLGRLNGQVEESISGLTIVKAFCMEDEMLRRFDENNEAMYRVATRALIWSGSLMPLTNVFHNLSYVAVSVVSGILAVSGSISIGMITSFLLYSRQFSRPFVNIASIYNSFQSAVAGAERIFEIMDTPSEPEDMPDALPLSSPKGNIEFKNVVFGYDKKRPVLKNISLRIPSGTRLAVVGPTGAGKTTLVNLLNRCYDVSEGEILLDGHDIRDYRIKELRSAFGVVPQDTALFTASVKENIRYGRLTAQEDEIEEAARIVGADAFIRRLPAGYDTVLTQGGQELSQGERQLLTIARALLTDAPILILDEATSSVDTVTEQKIRRAMLTITEGRTSFIIAHRLSTIRDSDWIILIEDGRIAEQGTHNELISHGGSYAAMYRMQMGL